ncbi:MAG: hypothetical protein R2838_01425 [Caldilineaceae bacterium]
MVITCRAVGSPITMTVGSSLQVSLPVTPTTTGDLVNPAAPGVCRADPSNFVAESNQGNNNCADTVSVQRAGPGRRQGQRHGRQRRLDKQLQVDPDDHQHGSDRPLSPTTASSCGTNCRRPRPTPADAHPTGGHHRGTLACTVQAWC